MKSTKYILFSLALATGVISCEPEFKDELSNASYSAGTADFSRYVAVGNSLTSGYMDGAMYRTGQSYSFPNLLAKQFALVGGGEFTQPSYADDVNNVGGIIANGNVIQSPKMIINLKAGGPQVINATPTVTLAPQAKAFNNMGVPGAKSFHLVAPGYGNPAGLPAAANPYFVRMATTPNTTVLADAVSLNPTFFTNWIGSNDVLSYALSGGAGVVRSAAETDPTTWGANDITSTTVFAGAYAAIMDALTANGAKGVVATIPNVTSIPYFTTVPFNPLTATALGQGNPEVGEATINTLNALFVGLNQGLESAQQAKRFTTFSTAAGNPVLIVDETLPDMSAVITAVISQTPYAALAPQLGTLLGKARHATASDLLVLTASSVIGTEQGSLPAPFNAFGVTVPLTDQFVLTPDEQANITTATTSFNQTIRQIAGAKDIPVADMNAIMQQLSTNGIVYSGIKYNANYFSTATVGIVLFSLDGVHPNARGYAFVANEVMKVIEKHYGAKLPEYVPNTFPGATILPTN
ncbi:G-D-S-L family lipolytic protein [Flavobacterium agricola]|uniref:G-D-S-L family lipolytic protein n=1 Tax=Flavobacterium agricola TaxID=2870839 RepID=A0ABY6LWL9_9FLAO|nr:G-D-S-L family lipolytic protein [Flavobacterium agricola]UYW00738.1 G-D-S-L family lipolytic protein [Flavobacterium agricola]